MKLKSRRVFSFLTIIAVVLTAGFLAICTGCNKADMTPTPAPYVSASPDPSAAPYPSVISPTPAMTPESQSTSAAATSPSGGTPSTPAGPDIGISKITVTFFGGAATSKGFTWYTGQTSQSSALEVLEKTGSAPDFSKSMMFTGTVSTPHNAPSALLHKAVATNLKSGTDYYYRVGDAQLNSWSSTAVFMTAPSGGPFSFIDVSDTQMADKNGADVAANTVKAAFNIIPGAGFLINNGDLVDSSSEAQWAWLIGSAQSILQNTTIMPVSGNHDSGKDFFIDHFNLDTKTEDTATGAYYSTDYSNAHLIVLNTNETSGGYEEFSDAQLAWMKADIGAARNAGAVWVIVAMHKGPYSTATHAKDADIVDTRKKVAPLFSQLGVDVVLQGHDHVYARSKPIDNGAAAVENLETMSYNGSPVAYLVNPGGTIYLTPGTAGVKHYYQNSSLGQAYLNLFDDAKGPFQGDPNLNNLETFVGFTIDGNKLTAEAYQINRSENNAKPVMIDRFGIIKQ